ncbi:hypothetical protein C671_0725 [[Clostridium] bifermentans ATCC 19299]|nr:hypothetical protein C671_0725 [[Clostridium] bifermentans ATCC 19299] [Paraclostridium bifermentans ATCC 19299]
MYINNPAKLDKNEMLFGFATRINMKIDIKAIKLKLIIESGNTFVYSPK